MTQNIIYFTASDVPTTEELVEIAAWNAFVNAYRLTVSNGSVAPGLGFDSEGDPVMDDAAFVAGTIPALYAEVQEVVLEDGALVEVQPEEPEEPEE
jgi:hypothetical protein